MRTVIWSSIPESFSSELFAVIVDGFCLNEMIGYRSGRRGFGLDFFAEAWIEKWRSKAQADEKSTPHSPQVSVTRKSFKVLLYYV